MKWFTLLTLVFSPVRPGWNFGAARVDARLTLTSVAAADPEGFARPLWQNAVQAIQVVSDGGAVGEEP
jgi:hypothetical protein